MSHGPLWMAFVYLAAAVAGVPLAKRLGLGSVLGYLLSGVVIGPFVLGLVGHEGHEVMHFAEFGVVMMLFLVGLELRPAVLWELRRPILGLGGLQVVLTTAVVTAGALALGLGWKPALAIGMTLSMSSTAIALQSLSEKSMLKTPGGQASFSVLLFQDIAVIPILAIFPLLAAAPIATTASSRPAWQHALLVAGAVALVVVLGRFLVRPVFRFLAVTRLRETFTAAALLLVIGIALLMQSVDLSPALGTFLAGVLLADSEYRHELESDIEPFKGLLLGVFFISVGAQIDFSLIAARPLPIVGLVGVVMLGKLVVLYGIARTFSLDRPARWLLAFALAQVGEFAFVLLSFATQSRTRIFDEETSKLLVAVVALSMAATPALFLALEKIILPRLTAARPRDQDTVTHEGNPVVIAGHGRFGQVVGRMLRANGIGTTVLDLDPGMVDLLARLGIKVFYGDASRPELLDAAGCRHAKLFVLAIDDTEAAVRIVHTLKQRYPELPVLARARNRAHYFELQKAGSDAVFRETFGSSYEMGIDAFCRLGHGPSEARRLAKRWRAHENHSLEHLGQLSGGDDKAYFAEARRMLEEAERLMREPRSVQSGKRSEVGPND